MGTMGANFGQESGDFLVDPASRRALARAWDRDVARLLSGPFAELPQSFFGILQPAGASLVPHFGVQPPPPLSSFLASLAYEAPR